MNSFTVSLRRKKVSQMIFSSHFLVVDGEDYTGDDGGGSWDDDDDDDLIEIKEAF